MNKPLDRNGKPMVCEHGQLARQCGYCEREKEIERLRADLALALKELGQAEEDEKEAVRLALEEAAAVCDGKASAARGLLDDYIAKCRADPANIGGGSQSWHQYFESCASAIRNLRKISDG